MELSILKTLGIVDCAILVKEENTHAQEAFFSLVDNGGTWLKKLLPNTNLKLSFSINNASVFLSDFLLDAQDFWSKQEQGQVTSGIWTEQCKDSRLFLEAYAAFHNGQCLLIIKNAEKSYHERKQTLQIAREMQFSNDAVIERHDYLTDRLSAILLDKAQIEQRLPLHEAIKYASIGIIITDNALQVQNVNPCAFEIFDQDDDMDSEYLLAMVSTLANRQHPEKSILKDDKGFNGEIFWHLPPLASKWLYLNIHPVFGLSGQLSHWIISISDQTRIKHLLQTNEELALHDSLTGLPNRQYFWQQLQQSIAHEHTFYLISIDIVNFKSINELYGYIEGDAILKQVAQTLKSSAHPNDFITRIGADEFMIIHKCEHAHISYSESRDFEALASRTFSFSQKIYNACRQDIYLQDGRHCDLCIKLGLAAYPNDALNPEDLMVAADLALSFAKVNSNPVAPIQMYSSSLKSASEHKLKVEAALKRAIESEELELYLQPIYDLHTQEIIKAECLLRWHHDNKTLYPDEFIPIAESSGCINAIGRWVISQALAIISDLQASNINIPIAINFSPKQLNDTNILGFIKQEVENKALKAKQLEFEITENVLINNYEKTRTFLNEIKSFGISITIDDFGTGYCSLAYLKNLPIDSIKIDRSFLLDIEQNEEQGAIVAAIIALAQKLNLNIVAEGVESSKQESFLLANNCSVAQGFLYAKPMHLEDFVALLQTSVK